MSETSPSRASKLLKVLDLKQIEENLYQGQNETENGSRLFGGQVLAQASAAAYRTVDKVHLHSLHAYFLRPGRVDLPVLYEVERVRDGRSFTMRRVVAIQKGQAIFNMDASFQGDEIGLEHSAPMPNVPMPDELREDVEVARELGGPKADPRMSPMAKVDRPFHLRSVFELGSDAWGDDRFWNPTWIKFREAVSLPNAIDDPEEAAFRLQALSRCLIAYASDMGLVSTAVLPHQSGTNRSDVQMASLDHSLWIHRSASLGQWLLFHKRTSTAQGSRGMVHSEFFGEDGTLVASMTQEGLLRERRDAS
jgi:acyl-CoA thioesterase-2